MSADLRAFYLGAKERVAAAGYGWEAEWQRTRDFDAVTEGDFLRELAWVILCSGFREKVIREKFGAISAAFCEWRSAEEITDKGTACIDEALLAFGNRRKIRAIATGARFIHSGGWGPCKQAIKAAPIEVLQKLPMIGPVTAYHLAKNLGMPVAKPDRHLVRMASEHGYSDVQDFCGDISELTGDSVPVVDIVLWRYAAEVGAGEAT